MQGNGRGKHQAGSSFYSDNSNAQMPQNQKNNQAPIPPNDKLIHISQCKNDRCPLQELLKNEKNGAANAHLSGYGRELDQQFVPYYACPKCQDIHAVKYCSQRCFQQDWFKIHQFECSGQMPEARDSVLLSDVQRIEASTPFIKEAYDESFLTPEQQKIEQVLSNINKSDLEFIQTKEANLGKGSYGEVQLARHKKNSIQIAVKKIEKASLSSSKIKETLIREIRIQKQLNHEYICRLYTSFEDKTTIYLALEYASKGNLFYLIRKEKFLSEDTAFYFFIQVCSGIYYLHKQGLIHRDIKPENILIKDGNIIKICDFGWCVQSDHMQQRNTFCGTLEYMAPEMIQNKNHNHTLDIWSLGILLYELVHGRAPFTGVHPREISDKIMRGQIRFKPGLSNEYKDLVNKILVYETSERLPLIKVFDHPWVKNFEKKYNLSKQPMPKKEKSKKKQQQQIPQAVPVQQVEKLQQQSSFLNSDPQLDASLEKKKRKQQQNQEPEQQIEASQPNPALKRQSARKTGNQSSLNNVTDPNDDIMKELEDIVNEKKATNKFLDDISDLDTHSTNRINNANGAQKERMSKKYKDKMAAEKEMIQAQQNTMAGLGPTDKQQQMDVYDYCDKMMKDLSHLDRKLDSQEKRTSARTNNQFDAYQAQPSTSKQNADQLLNSYLNQADDSAHLNPTNISHMSHASLVSHQSVQLSQHNQSKPQNGNMTKLQQIQKLQQQQQQNKQARSSMREMKNQMRQTNHSMKSKGGRRQQQMDDSQEDSNDEEYDREIDAQQDVNLLETNDDPHKNRGYNSNEDGSIEEDDEERHYDDWYEEGKDQIGKKKQMVDKQQQEISEQDEDDMRTDEEEENSRSEEDADDDMEDLVNAHNYQDHRNPNAKKPKLKGMDPIYDGAESKRNARRQAANNRRNKNQNSDDEEDASDADEDYSSDEEEENQTFMQKLGGFLFFGCGGGSKR